MSVFLTSFQAVLVLFLFIVVGFVACRTKILPENAASVLSKMENYILIPAVVFNVFTKYCTVESFTAHSDLVAASALVLTVGTLLAIALSYVFSKKGSYTRYIYQYALTYGNYGFMGIPLVVAVLGEEALYLYMIYLLPIYLVAYSYGLYSMKPMDQRKENALKSLLNPIILSIAFSIIVGLSGLGKYIPAFIRTAVTDCADCQGPIAMIITGFTIGGYRISEILKNGKVYLATLLRLIVLPLLFMLGLQLIGAEDTALRMTLFAFGTPLGLNTVVFPAAYGGETKTGASMALISHTLCLITIPLMYTLLENFILK